MIASLIGAGVAAASAIGGAISSANKSAQAKRMLDTQKRENKKWFDMKMAEDYTSRSENQAILNKQRDLLNEQYKRARATNTVAGGTEQQLALQKEAANQTLADNMMNIAVRSSEYRDQAEKDYRTENTRIDNAEIAVKEQESAQVAQAASQGVQAGLNLIGSELNGKGKVSKVTEDIAGQTQKQIFEDAKKQNKLNIPNPFGK